jgi:hydrogenase-4 membrane subunit HyfE
MTLVIKKLTFYSFKLNISGNDACQNSLYLQFIQSLSLKQAEFIQSLSLKQETFILKSNICTLGKNADHYITKMVQNVNIDINIHFFVIEKTYMQNSLYLQFIQSLSLKQAEFIQSLSLKQAEFIQS